MLVTTNEMLIFVILLISSMYFTMAAPVCYNCDSGCNDTVTSNDGNMNNFEWVHSNRTRRRSTIEQRSCYKFQLELVLIPLSIAMIPLGLCALLLCVCFCGPKESRGKLPETFRKKAKIDAKDANEIDNEELTCKNGIIMRKDSKKTRFSTTISFIEANCTNDKMNKNEQSVIPNSLLFAAAKDEKYVAENDETVTVNNNNQTATTQISMNERKLGDKKGYN
ncbi:putative integral membrane protein [Acanthocheilonema viteae]